MPIQMLAIVTEASDQVGEVSQSTGPMPTWPIRKLTTPDSELSSQAQVEADTISGSSHGTRNRARRTTDSRKCREKNTASARPIVNWKNSDTRVKITVCRRAGPKVGS